LRVLRGCLLQRIEETGPYGHRAHLVQCPPRGYAENYKVCHHYVKAVEDELNPEELRRSFDGETAKHKSAQRRSD
jgi:hypothetical protein